MKCDEAQVSFENLFREVMFLKREKIAVDEIKRDRDQRLKLCRDEIAHLENQLASIEKDHAALQVNYDSAKSENDRMTVEHREMGENLALANKVRNQTETKLSELTKQYNVLKQGFNECDKLMGSFRRKYEEEQKRLGISEKKCDELKIQKGSLEKQNEIHRRQLLDKIN